MQQYTAHQSIFKEKEKINNIAIKLLKKFQINYFIF